MGLKWITKINLPIGQIIYDYGSGMTLTDIGKKYGVYKDTIRNRLEEAGVYQLHMREAKVSLKRELEPNLVDRRGRGKINLPVERVIYDCGSGMTVSELAEKYGVSHSTIRTRMKEAGVILKRRINLPMERVIYDYRSGMTYAELGEKYGVSPPTIRNRLKEADVKKKPKGEM